MATFIHGIAASENIDSSGERISIAGMDISSLEKDGVFNYEHETAKVPDKDGRPVELQVKIPSQTVGKILKAKKIFKEEDCEDDNQIRFWRKIETPYLYVMGELFDEYTDAARDLAGKFRYDRDKKGQNQAYVNNFSIEGARIEKKGMEIPRSIARKVTITITPCNKTAVAEIMPTREPKDVNELFKTESTEIELFQMNEKTMVTLFNKEDALQKSLTTAGAVPATAPKDNSAGHSSPTNNPGSHLGSTKSGKKVFSHAKIHEYHGFSSQDHKEAAGFHHSAAGKSTDRKTSSHHLDKMKLHMQASGTSERKEGRFAAGKQQAASKALIHKASDAGSAMAAPSELSQGAALAKEDLDKKDYGVHNQKGVHLPPLADKKGGTSVMGSHVREPSTAGHGSKEMARRHAQNTLKQIKSIKPKLDKSELFVRAEQEYQKWEKREAFVNFMKKRLPHLTKGEIDAIGRTLALSKSVKAEKSLNKMVGAVTLAEKEKKNER